MQNVANAFGTWFASLGATGYAIPVLGLVIGYLLWQKYRPQGGSTIPSPIATAATQPPLLAGESPLLHDLLVKAGRIPAKGATTADVDHATLLQLNRDIAALNAAHEDAHYVARSDLQPVPPAKADAPK